MGNVMSPALNAAVPLPARLDSFTVRPDGTYLITGGLGGIGLAVARWLVEQGARHLLLVGRTPLAACDVGTDADPGSPAARRAAAVAALGANVETAAIDVAVEPQLEQCLEKRRLRGAPPICGVFHAAGVAEFQPLAMQDAASLRSGLAAKFDGAWRLHRLLTGVPLDCFVLFSSSSALLSWPLLGGYAAGNAFLDALAHHRRAHGLAALSINWGTWAEVGMAFDAGRSANGAMPTGAGMIATSQGLAALQELLTAGDTQTAVMPVDWFELAAAYPAIVKDPFLEEMVAMLKAATGPRILLVLPVLAFLESSPDQRRIMVGSYLREQAARVLGMQVARLDDQLTLSSYGFDSLMAVQLEESNRVRFGHCRPADPVSPRPEP